MTVDPTITILLIEDEPAHAELVRRAFQSRGKQFELITVSTLNGAFKIIEDKRPDLIITDWALPDGDGGRLLSHAVRNGDLPVIVMTSYGNEQTAVEAIRSGALDYVVKSAETMSDMPHVAERALREWKLIHDRSMAVEALRESEIRFRALSENAPDIIYTLSHDGRFTYVNPAWEKILGHPAYEVMGRSLSEFVAEEDREDIDSLLLQVCAGPDAIQGLQGAFLHKNGTRRIFLVSCGPNMNSDGNVIGAVGLLKDITATIQLERQLLQSQKMEALGTLAGGVAHEFNNVLTAIKGYTQLMAINKEMTDSLRELLEKIDESTGRARDLTRKLLTFSRIESGAKTSVDINSVVNTVVDLILHTFPRNIKVRLDLDQDLGVISANSTQLEQVILNLSLNAKDAMPDGGELTFTTGPRRLDESFCRVNPWAKPGHYVVLGVTDTGSGIDPNVVARIFEPFYTTKEAEKGTGLGLSVAYSIIRGHSGGILVDSQPENGTRFDLFFPVQEVPVVEIQDETITAPLIKGQGEHVLVVDDENAVREVTRSALDNFGYQVDEAANGKEALEKFHRALDAGRPYQLILLDLAMPVMDGRECYHRLINLDTPPRILIATGHLSDRQTFEEKFPQAMGLLQKPFDLRTLLDEVHKALTSPLN